MIVKEEPIISSQWNEVFNLKKKYFIMYNISFYCVQLIRALNNLKHFYFYFVLLEFKRCALYDDRKYFEFIFINRIDILVLYFR